MIIGLETCTLWWPYFMDKINYSQKSTIYLVDYLTTLKFNPIMPALYWHCLLCPKQCQHNIIVLVSTTLDSNTLWARLGGTRWTLLVHNNTVLSPYAVSVCPLPSKQILREQESNNEKSSREGHCGNSIWQAPISIKCLHAKEHDGHIPQNIHVATQAWSTVSSIVHWPH